MIWFTADTHFGHPKICELSNRPFASLKDMTEALIRNWKERVGRGDIVYHLGDFMLTGKRVASDGPIVDAVLGALNGQKFLCPGNHDKDPVIRSKHWTKVSPYMEIKADLGGETKQRIVLCHYALRVWNQNGRGSWMLHGHSHGNLSDIGGKTLDVGVDCWDYCPVSLTAISQTMDTRPAIAWDHHAVED